MYDPSRPRWLVMKIGRAIYVINLARYLADV
jgi:hypothetical protein